MIVKPTSLAKKIPYIGPVISGVGLTLDVKDIIENATPLGAARIIGGRLLKECTPPELLIAGKCMMLTDGVIASVASAGNPLIVSGTISAARSIIRD